jgi:hypothetical protein
MLQILNTMDDTSLSSALSAVGIESGMDEGMEDGMFDPSGESLSGQSGDELQSWNARDVALPPPNKPPFLVDKSQFIKGAQPTDQEQYMAGGMSEPDGDEQYYAPPMD